MRAEFSETKNRQSSVEQKIIKRGDIYWADLGVTVGSEQGGVRPVIVIQNNIGNKFSPTVIVSAITSQLHKAKLPTHVSLSKDYGLEKDSVVLLEQIRTLDKRRLRTKISSINEKDILDIDSALQVSISQEIGRNERELKEIKEEINRKVQDIVQLDIFIKKWIDRGGKLNDIMEDCTERNLKVKELKSYCEKNNQKMEEYYNVNHVREYKGNNIKKVV